MVYEKYDYDQSLCDVIGSIGFTDSKDEIILLVRSSFANQNFDLHEKQGIIQCSIKDFNLAPGSYNSMLFLSYRETETLDCIPSAFEITVEGGDFFGTGNSGFSSHCKVLTRSSWEVGT